MADERRQGFMMTLPAANGDRRRHASNYLRWHFSISVFISHEPISGGRFLKRYRLFRSIYFIAWCTLWQPSAISSTPLGLCSANDARFSCAFAQAIITASCWFIAMVLLTLPRPLPHDQLVDRIGRFGRRLARRRRWCLIGRDIASLSLSPPASICRPFIVHREISYGELSSLWWPSVDWNCTSILIYLPISIFTRVSIFVSSQANACSSVAMRPSPCAISRR